MNQPPPMVRSFGCREIAKALHHMPPFYQLQLRTPSGCTLEIVVVRKDPESGECKDWGRVDGGHITDEATEVAWLPGCPPPQFAVIPAPEPDVTDEREFPTEKMQRTLRVLAQELVRRSQLPSISIAGNI
jgi:hypothetical protein